MAIQKSITKCLAVFLVLGFITLAMPEQSTAGIGEPPVLEPGCCQFLNEEGFTCNNSPGLCRTPPGAEFIDFFPGETCNQSGLCTGFTPVSNVPTLSEWGLIAMSGVLGIVGFMVMRRKRATA